MGEIRFERRGRLGVVTLDRQQALNALSHPMVRELSATLAAWCQDQGVAVVLVKAAPGRAFCAGGDIRTVADLVRERGVEAATPFFRDEYRMNWRVHTFPKPYVALLDGITMGGGVGISVHGTFRVVTENAVLAMPETGIGFFPDVGGTWFLPRCPGAVGTWLGLTGSRLLGAGIVAAGLGTHAVPAARLAALEDALAAGPDGADAAAFVAARLAACAGAVGEPAPAAARAAIDACFSAGTLAEIASRLATEPTGWGRGQLDLLATKSPLALQLTLAQLARGRGATIAECLALEYRMVHRMLAAGDFAEGVRALLVDKDRRPRWRHADLAAVDPAEIAAMMAPLPQGELTFDWRSD